MKPFTITFAVHPDYRYSHQLTEIPDGDHTVFVLRGGAMDGYGYIITDTKRAEHAITDDRLVITAESEFATQLSRRQITNPRRKQLVTIQLYWDIGNVDA